MSVSGNIADIQRSSFHDGPGIRTVVFFKGCNMQCAWCHNPEMLSCNPDILYAPIKCIQCGSCTAVCPSHFSLSRGSLAFVRDGCTHCGRCADACPSGALTTCGNEMPLEEVFAEIIKDRHYYTQSGGGVTLSGGECLLQPAFAKGLLGLCKESAISTAIESALNVPWKSVATVVPFADIVFADLKIPDAKKHRLYTGCDSALILENIRRLSQQRHRIKLRIPMIPGVNDTADDMQAFAALIDTFGSGIEDVELLRYNPLGQSKYYRIGTNPVRFGVDTPQTDAKMAELCSALSHAMRRNLQVFYRE